MKERKEKMKTINTNELRKAIDNLPTELGLINKSDVKAVITTLEKENENEFIKVNEKLIEKKWAFPDLEGDQTALMLKWDGEKWTVSSWGCNFYPNNKEVLGWEPLSEVNKATALEIVEGFMTDIENENREGE
jgi:hypothetical protein